jgi:hypothetical protein
VKTWGAPPDAVAWGAFAVGLSLVIWPTGRARFGEALCRVGSRWFVGVAAGLAAALSVGYVAYYLGGAPRIIDATSYFLGARVFASGQLAFDPPGPLASFNGRFLHTTPDGALAPIFPPGYPLALAGPMVLGAPMLFGPLLAAALVALTYALARRLSRDELVARLAAVLSVLCAALRYHTADTMSHGWAAVLLCAALYLAGTRSRLNHETAGHMDARAAAPALTWAIPLGAGLLVGWLFATRPLSGLIAAFAVALQLGFRPRNLALAAAGSCVGVFGFVWHQWRLTGRLGHLVQHHYYNRADGPPGCVHLGFGADVGCRGEHGDFIARYMPDGYGLLEAIATTGRRLAMHASDAGNLELFFPLLIAALVLSWRQPALRNLTIVVLAQPLAYAVFYFDGNYPGGGARLLSDVLPLEHILLAWVLVRWRIERWAAPAMLIGFALHTSFDHRQLAERDGGAPMFDRSLVPLDQRLVFVGTDHGFNLGFDPAEADSLVVARYRGDAFDHALWQNQGRPPSGRYTFDFSGLRTAIVSDYRPEPSRQFQAASLWPPGGVHGGWIELAQPHVDCGSSKRVIRLHPIAGPLTVDFDLWLPADGDFRLRLVGDSALSVVVEEEQRSPTSRVSLEPCREVEIRLGPQIEGPVRVSLAFSGPADLHWLELVGGSTASP